MNSRVGIVQNLQQNTPWAKCFQRTSVAIEGCQNPCEVHFPCTRMAGTQSTPDGFFVSLIAVLEKKGHRLECWCLDSKKIGGNSWHCICITKPNKTHISQEHGTFEAKPKLQSSDLEHLIRNMIKKSSQYWRFGWNMSSQPALSYMSIPCNYGYVHMDKWNARSQYLQLLTAKWLSLSMTHHGSIKSSHIPHHKAPAHFWNEQRQDPICRLTTSFFLDVCCLFSSWMHSCLKGSLWDKTTVQGCCAERGWSRS